MSGLVVIMPMTELYNEIQSNLSMMHEIIGVDHLVHLAIKRHFQGAQLDLLNDPVFCPWSKGLTREMDVKHVDDIMLLSAESLQKYFQLAGIDPRDIKEVTTCNKDLLIRLGEGLNANNYQQGIFARAIPNVRPVAMQGLTTKQSDD